VDWDVDVVRGSARAFHARPVPDGVRPSLWWFEVDRPALVLGSTQQLHHIDLAACEREGVEVVRRNSGGGAVLLVPEDVIWFDVIIPRGHARWNEDISRAAWWVGDAVCAAIGDPALEVHRGPMVRTPWSEVVCFAGLGPGEVVRGNRKVLGLSQRRTRSWIRYQCAIYRRWDAARLVGLLQEPLPPLAELQAAVGTATLTLDALVRALG